MTESSSDAAIVCVVGSANLDIVVPVPHHPTAGETVMGGDHALIPGGKGANQAVAAARLGANVRFVGRVGDDDAGASLRASLVEAGVDTSDLVSLDDTPSGIALISVAEDGDNAIVVSPGANGRLTADDVRASFAGSGTAAVTLVQLEVPMDAVVASAKAATGTTILNPAPGAPLPAELLAAVDIVIPNETELDILGTGDSVESKARSIGVDTVIVTLGADGALIVTADNTTAVPAPTVSPVDTTGAGDSFCGAVATELAAGSSIAEAVALAVRVGATTTLRAGAQSSLPTRSEVDDLLS